MIVTRVDPVSVAKIAGVVYATIGLLVGIIVSLISMMFGGTVGGGMLGPSVGIGAIFVFPVLYGLLGFISSFIGASIYNWAAGRVGGVRIDIE